MNWLKISGPRFTRTNTSETRRWVSSTSGSRKYCKASWAMRVALKDIPALLSFKLVVDLKEVLTSSSSRPRLRQRFVVDNYRGPGRFATRLQHGRHSATASCQCC